MRKASVPEGPVFGLLRLDAEPFDVPGCTSCEETFPFPRICQVVKGATVEKMTAGCTELIGPMIDAAKELERQEVVAILGECGFMALFQEILQEQVQVPVFTSSLLIVPWVSRMLPQGRRVGILTFRSTSLREEHFRSAGWSSQEVPIAVAGVEDQSAWKLILTPEHPYQGEELEEQLLVVCRRLMDAHPDLGALVLECGIMPVFAHRIQTLTGLPVFDITTLAAFVHQALSRRPFRRLRGEDSSKANYF